MGYLVHNFYRNEKWRVFYMVYKIIYTYLIYSGILLFCLFKNIGYGGILSFHKILEMLLLFTDGNHVQKSIIVLDIIQLVKYVILGRGKRRRNSLKFGNFDSLYISTL
jgi:hypothetical protein